MPLEMATKPLFELFRRAAIRTPSHGACAGSKAMLDRRSSHQRDSLQCDSPTRLT